MLKTSKRIITLLPLIASLLWVTRVQAQDPAQTVRDTVTQLLRILNVNNESQRVSQLCELVNARVDAETVSQDLLGRQYANLDRDRSGLNRFQALLPSIIVSEFYRTLSGIPEDQIQHMSSLVPKGSSRIGVRLLLAGQPLIVTLNRANLQVVDVEYVSISLVTTKRTLYQRELRQFFYQDEQNSRPVTQLTNQLVQSGRLLVCSSN